MDIDSRQQVDQQDLAEISCEVLTGLLGLEIGCAIGDAAGRGGVSASVSILGGDHRSSVIISAERPLAEAVAISFFGDSDEQPATLGILTSAAVDEVGSKTVHVSTAW